MRFSSASDKLQAPGIHDKRYTWLRGATGFSGIEFNGFAVVQKSGFGDREVGDIETLVDCGREGSDDAQLAMIVMRNRLE